MSLLAVVVFMLAGSSQSKIGSIRDRPLTWDWNGMVPLYCAQKPSPEQARMFDAMQSGDYYLADPPTRAHFAKHPDDLVDAWILFQCASKRGKVDELLADTARWVVDSPTTATRMLRLNTLNLSFMVKVKNNPTHDPMNGLRKEITEAEVKLRPDAAKNIAAMTAVLGSLNNEVKAGRETAKALSDAMPNSVEAAMLYVRSLLRGDFGAVLATADAQGKIVQAPRKARMELFRPSEPRMDDALAELDRVEKRLGKHPLLDYYRAVAYAMKSYFYDPKKDDEAKLEATAVAWTERFLKNSSDYPRLEVCAKKYLARRRFSAFFPWPDE